MGLFGRQTAKPPLWLPVAPYALYSMVRYQKWHGLCCQVRRTSGGATKDIGFDPITNRVDAAAITRFLGGGAGTYSKWYDQSGNARDLSQTTVANQPSVALGNILNGALPVCFDSVNFGTFVNKFFPFTGWSVTAQALSIFCVTKPSTSFSLNAWFEIRDASSNAQVALEQWGDGVEADDAINAGLKTYNPAANVTNNADSLIVREQLSTIGVTCGTNGTTGYKIWMNGTSQNFDAVPATALTNGQFGGSSSTSFGGVHDTFAYVIHNSELSVANVALQDSMLRQAFGVVTWPSISILCDGGSKIMGYASQFNNHGAWIAEATGLLRQKINLYNVGIYGSTQQKIYDDRAFGAVHVIGAVPGSKKIYYLDAGAAENDIEGSQVSGRGTTVYNSYFKPMLSAMRTAGSNVIVVSTATYDGGLTSTGKAEVDTFNNLVRAGIGTDSDILIDIGGRPELQDPTNTTYYQADQTHFTDFTQRTIHAPMLADGFNRALVF